MSHDQFTIYMTAMWLTFASVIFIATLIYWQHHD